MSNDVFLGGLTAPLTIWLEAILEAMGPVQRENVFEFVIKYLQEEG